MIETRRDKARPRSGILGFLLLQSLLVLLFFAPAFLSGEIVLPAELLHALYPWGAYFSRHINHNRDLTDVVLQFYPWFVHWGERVRELSWPLWNPLSGLGLPFAANPQTCSYFPLTALSLLPKAVGWNAVLLARLVLAGASAFAWLRHLGRSRGAAGIGAVAYSFSFPFFALLPWPHANVNALLPLLLLTARRVALRPGRSSALAFAATLLLAHLGGHPESVFLDVGAVLVVFALPGRPVAPRTRLRATGWLALAGVLGTAAAAIQLFPFLEYLSRSRVWLEPGHEPVPLARRYLVSWLAPLFYGSSVTRTLLPGDLPFTDRGAYVGITVLALAMAGLATRPSLRKIGAPLSLVILSAGLAYGIPPVSWLLNLPLLEKTSVQRSLYVAALGLATLGAVGIDRLRALRRRRPGRFVASWLAPVVLGLGLAVFLVWARPKLPPPMFSKLTLPECVRAMVFAVCAWIPLSMPARGRLGRHLSIWGLGLVVITDLWRIALPFHGSVAPDLVFFPTQLTRFLSGQAAGHRVLPLHYVMPPNLNLPYDLPSVLSYDAVDPIDENRFLRELGGFPGIGLYTTVVFPQRLRNPEVARLAGIQDLIDDPTAPPLDTPQFLATTGFALERVYDRPDGRVYRLSGALPLVSCRIRARPDPGLNTFRRFLAAADPRASRDLFVDQAVVQEGSDGTCTLSWSRSIPERIQARVDSSAGGWVVVAEAFDDGWKATVDRVPAPIVRANEVLRAIRIEAGPHVVEVAYRPASFRWGAAVSLGALVVLALLALPAWAGARSSAWTRRRWRGP